MESDSDQQQQQQTLFERLSNYTIVNTVCQSYSNIKERNSYLKAGLETAENLTQPVLKKLDDKLHLDQHGVAILDKLETTTTDITTRVTDYYQQGVDLYTHSKETAVEKGVALLSNANRPVNQLLDITEAVVNKILPPEFPIPKIDSDDDDDDDGEMEDTTTYATAGTDELTTTTTEGEGERLAANPLPRIQQMGTGVTKRLRSRLQKVKSQRQLESIAYVVDLIQYAADYIDLDGKTRVIKENASTVQAFLEEQKDVATTKFVIPAKEIIEQQTSDIKEQGIKAVVGVVATFAHVTEVVRRQLENKVPSVEKLQTHLQNITLRVKESILKLKGSELTDYLNIVRETYVNALHSILELTSSYVPTRIAEALPMLTNLIRDWSSWRLSLTARLALKNTEQQQEQQQQTRTETSSYKIYQKEKPETHS